MIKIALVVGTRPNFMKAIPVWNSLKEKIPKEQLYLIHTGQHYSHNLSKIFIDEFDIDSKEIIYLEKYSGETYPKLSIPDSFSWIIKHLSHLFVNENINKVIVFGDVNSTLAAGLAAKLNNIHLIHIESGLRSYDLDMPEERNRILIDRMSDQLFITEISARENLKNEGIINNIYHCGNTMIDTLIQYLSLIKNSLYYLSFNVNKLKYILFTLHRQQNVENKNNLEKIIKSVITISKILKHSVLFIAHPRTIKNINIFKIDIGEIILIKPQSYINMLNLVYNSGILLTDSGGLQEETSYLGIPCITIRKNTERPITIQKGYNYLISPDEDNFYNLFENKIIEIYATRKYKLKEIQEEMGYGNASDKIVKKILN